MTDIAQIEIGEEARRFLATELGKYIDGCTEQDIENAKDELLELDPYVSKTLKELQNAISQIQQKAINAASLRGYIAEAIINGDQAIHQLQGE